MQLRCSGCALRSSSGSGSSSSARARRRRTTAAAAAAVVPLRAAAGSSSSRTRQWKNQQQQQLLLLGGRRGVVACRSTPEDAAAAAPPPAVAPPPLVVVEGDVVTFHMTCRGPDGAVLESSREAGEPLSFEIGAGEVTGNPLFQAFDGALRGRGIGEAIELEISGGEWKRELLFSVPRDHPEIERLEGRYKNLGGLAKDLAVELANGTMAVVVEATPEAVTLDANSMLSGKTLTFELEVLGIERP